MKRVNILKLCCIFVLLTICGCDVCAPEGGEEDDLSGKVFFTAFSLGGQRPTICYVDANGDAIREISTGGTLYSAPSNNNKIAYLVSDTVLKKNLLYMGNIFGGSGINISEVNDYFVFNPILSPDGAKIAFYTGNSDLYMWVNDQVANSKYIDQVTPILYENTQASFSPDGKALAFVENVDGKASLVVVESAAPDKELYRKTFTGSVPDLRTFDGPTWSPKGSELAFVTQNEAIDYLTIISVPGYTEKVVEINAKTLGARSAASFDGARFTVFTSREGALWLLTLDGDKQRFTALTETDSTQVCLYPQWSENGKYIIYNVYSSLDDRDAHSQLALIELNLKNTTQPVVRRQTLANNSLRGYWKK